MRLGKRHRPPSLAQREGERWGGGVREGWRAREKDEGQVSQASRKDTGPQYCNVLSEIPLYHMSFTVLGPCCGVLFRQSSEAINADIILL